MPERVRDRGRFAVGVDEVGEDADKLHRLRERDPGLDRPTGHVRKFAVMTAGRHGDRLDDWIADAEQDTPAPRASFARNLRRDLAAVRNGLSLPYSPSAVEDDINRLKVLERQLFGRAGLDGTLIFTWGVSMKITDDPRQSPGGIRAGCVLTRR